MNGSQSNGGVESPIDKFEQAYMNCLTALTKEDTLTNVDKDEIRVDVEQGIANVVECAREMECYFIKKRLEIAAQKPELLLKDDTTELRLELLRKDELLKKNFDKISYWQSILADLQAGGGSNIKPPSTPNPGGTPIQHPGTPQPLTPAGSGRPQTPLQMPQQQSVIVKPVIVNRKSGPQKRTVSKKAGTNIATIVHPTPSCCSNEINVHQQSAEECRTPVIVFAKPKRIRKKKGSST